MPLVRRVEFLVLIFHVLRTFKYCINYVLLKQYMNIYFYNHKTRKLFSVQKYIKLAICSNKWKSKYESLPLKKMGHNCNRTLMRRF